MLLAALLPRGVRLVAPMARTRSSRQVCCASAPRASTPRSATTTPANGELVGYDVDVAKAVGEKLGVRVEFVETPWDAMFAALEANRFDVVANEVTINDERKAKYDLSEPYSVGEGVIVTRADDNSIKSLADLKGKVGGRERDQQLGGGRPQGRRPGRGRRGLHPGHQAAQPGPGGRRRQRQHRGATPTSPRPATRRVKIAGNVGEKSEQGFAARKDSGLLPDLNKALDELRADGTLAKISQKYLKANASGGPTAPAPDATSRRGSSSSTACGRWRKAAITKTIPLTIISFVIGLVIALAVALARLSTNVDSDQHRPVLHLDHPRHPAAGAVVHRVLRAAPVRREDRPVARRDHRVLPERRRLRRGDHPLGDPEHPEGPVGGGRDDRPRLRRRAAADHPAAGHPGGGAAAVEHVDLAGEGHVAGVDDPGHRTAAASTDHRRTEVRVLRALRHGRGVLLGHLPGALVRPEPLERRLERYVAR